MIDPVDRKTETAARRPDGDETRRDALVRMGRFAGYTAPAMLALLGATKARAQVAGSPGEGRPGAGNI